MAPGGSTYKEVLESHMTVSEYDTASAKTENDATPNKATGGMGSKYGICSTNGVHELLECPVCTNLMYPPIHQARAEAEGHRTCLEGGMRML